MRQTFHSEKKWTNSSIDRFRYWEKEMVGVGLIGTGFMGKCHAIAWSAVGAVFPYVAKPKLVHLGEVNEELAKRKAGEFGFAKASGDWRAVVNDPEVDIVSLTTPNQFHPEMAI